MSLKAGMKVRIRSEGTPFHLKEGEVYDITESHRGDHKVDVFFHDTGEIVEFNIDEVRIPLHHGAFIEGEDPELWKNQFAAARVKLMTLLASGAFERVEDLSGIDVPDEILSWLKKIISVLGSAEGIALIKALLVLL